MTHQIDTNDLEFAEKRYGKLIGWVPGAIKKGKINPQVTMGVREDGEFVSVFHVKPVYYETATGHWRPLSEVTTHHGNRTIILNENWWKVHPRYLNWLDKRCKIIGGELLIPSSLKSYPTPYTGIVRSLHESLVPLKLGLTTTTFYPDPNAESTSVDGYVDRTNRTTWSDARDTADGTTFNDSATVVYLIAEREATSTYNVYRGFFLFDTSAIPDTDTVSSATFSTNTNDTGGSTGGTLNGVLIQTSPASNTALATGDFDALTVSTPDEGATRISPNGSTGYKDWTLNATGISWISKVGVTKLGLRVDYDVDNTTPTSVGRRYWGVASADTANTTSDPKLVVVHAAAAAGPAGIKTWNGLAQASVKTVNGLAIASVKSGNGLT